MAPFLSISFESETEDSLTVKCKPCSHLIKTGHISANVKTSFESSVSFAAGSCYDAYQTLIFQSGDSSTNKEERQNLTVRQTADGSIVLDQ